MNERQFIESAIQGLPYSMRVKAEKAAKKYLAGKREPLTQDLFIKLYGIVVRELREKGAKNGKG